MEEFNRRWLAAWTAKDVEALLGFYTPDALYFDQQTAAGIQGHAALAAYLTGLFGMTPPMRYEAEAVWAIKGGFCGRWYCTIGDAATPALRGFDLVLMEGDRIARNEVYVHTLGAAA